MFHSLKRATVGNLAARNEPTNTEYEHLRKSLDEISKRLQTNLTQFENVQRKWSHIVEDQETFYLDLINSTNNLQNTQHQLPLHPPPPQDKNTIYHQSADIVYTGVRSGMQNMSKPGGNHTLLILGVRAFITELKAISVECVRVDKARTDFIMYSQKLDKLKNNMYDSSSERYDRNKEKMEKTKVLYDALLHAVLLKMTRCYEKSNFMFQSLFVVYNSYSIGMCHLLSYQLNPINDYCREHEQELVDYMISTNNNPNGIQDNNNNNNNSNDVPITNNNNNNNSNNNIYFMNNTNTTDEGNIFTNNQQQPNHGIGMNVHSTQHHQQQPIDPSFYDSPQGVNQHGYGHV